MTRDEALVIAKSKRKIPPLLVRFWSKVNILGPDDCWEWTKAKRRPEEGYGAFWYKGRHHPLNRMAYLLTYGEIPKGLNICHSCDNPSCCNPDHLFAATHQVNNQDKVDKKRHAFGEKIGTAKLTEIQVLEIKKHRPIGRARKGLTKELSDKYSVTKGTISEIWSRRWKHLD